MHMIRSSADALDVCAEPIHSSAEVFVELLSP